MRDQVAVQAVLTTELTHCLQEGCGSTNIKANGSGRMQHVAHTPLDGKPRVLAYRRQSYYCRDCKKSSLQPIPGLYKGTNMTRRLRRHIARRALLPGVTFRDLALEVGLSERTVRNVFRKHAAHLREIRPLEAPRVMGMDGVYVDRQESLIVTDLERRRVVQLRPFIKERPVAAALREMKDLDKVEEVVADMAPSLDRVQQVVMPKAIRTKDRYHAQREANNAVDFVRRKIHPGRKGQKKGESLMCSSHLLRKRRHQLDQPKKSRKGEKDKKSQKGERAALEWCLGLYPELKLTYELKELCCDFWDSPDEGTGRAKFAECLEMHARWKEAMPEDLRGAFDKFFRLMENWEDGIFNYFRARHTNGYTEAANARVKRLVSRAPRANFETVETKIVHGMPADQRRRAVRKREKEKRRQARRGEHHAPAPPEAKAAPTNEVVQKDAGQARPAEPEMVPAEKKELGPRLEVARIAALMGNREGGEGPTIQPGQTLLFEWPNAGQEPA